MRDYTHLNILPTSIWGGVITIFCLLMPSYVMAASQVGIVKKVDGTSIIYKKTGGSIYARANTAVYEGDTIQTSAGKVFITMTDKSSYTVYPKTSFVIKDYHYDPASKGSDRTVMELLRGKFGFVSGIIGKRNPRAVQYRAGIATMGIRGTEGIITFIDGYYEVKVTDGAVVVGGSTIVNVGETAYFQKDASGNIISIDKTTYDNAIAAKTTTSSTFDDATDLTTTPLGGGLEPVSPN